MRALTKELLGAAALTLAGQAAHAATLIPITPPPGAATAIVLGINDNNVIAGGFTDANGVEHGFLGPLNGPYAVFDLGGTVTGTEPRSISNGGIIVGFARDPEFTVGREFMRLPNGTLSPITKGSVWLDGVAQGVVRSPAGITSVGDYLVEDGTFNSGYFARNAAWTRDFNVSAPNVHNTKPRAINAAGTVAGFVEMNDAVRHGFILKAGQIQIIDADATGTTALEGMNNEEVVTGQVADASGNPHSFFYIHATGQFRSIEIDDGSVFQQAWAVNNARLMTVSTSIGVSYVYCPRPADQCPAGGFEVPDGRSWYGSSQLDARQAGAGTPTHGVTQ